MFKWFFALSEASLGHPGYDWEDLIRVAVRSAQRHTRLSPHFIYDGQEGPFTAELRDMGVTVIRHQLSYMGNIMGRWGRIGLPQDPGRVATMAGAYLRTEIPNIVDDEFVLYTDCDVLFLRDPEVERFRPAYFACAPQRYPDDLGDMNSGVMVMNVPGMRKELANFYHLIVENFERYYAHDQDALREYYEGRFDTLPLELNWKPYWGRNDAAAVVHFHGPKPRPVRQLIDNPAYPYPEIWRELFFENPAAYQYYLAQWDAQLAEALVTAHP